MITKEQLIESMKHEVSVIKHLATKVPESKLDWRPTPEQRSMLELMRYLTATGLSMATYCVSGNWDHGKDLKLEADKVTSAVFAEAMDKQVERIELLLADIDGDAASTTKAMTAWGTETSQGCVFTDAVIKSFVAYRMQLFLYLKQATDQELTSYNCWVGEDAPAKV